MYNGLGAGRREIRGATAKSDSSMRLSPARLVRITAHDHGRGNASDFARRAVLAHTPGRDLMGGVAAGN
jgi:hypothetical protein